MEIEKALISTIPVIVGFTLITWVSLVILYFSGAEFEYGLFLTMSGAFMGYTILFIVVATITEIIVWLYKILDI